MDTQELTHIIQSGMLFNSKCFNPFRNDKDLVLQAVSLDGTAAKYISPDLLDDKDVALASVKKNAWTIFQFSERLQVDLDVVHTSLSKHISVYKYLKTEVKEPSFITLPVLQQDPELLEHAPDLYKQNITLFLNALNTEKSIYYKTIIKQLQIETTSPTEQNILDFFNRIVEKDPNLLKFAPFCVKNNYEIVLKSLHSSYGMTIKHASEELQKNPKILLQAYNYGANNITTLPKHIIQEINPNEKSKEEITSYLLGKILELKLPHPIEKKQSLKI